MIRFICTYVLRLHFDKDIITPCGIEERGVTSISEVLTVLFTNKTIPIQTTCVAYVIALLVSGEQFLLACGYLPYLPYLLTYVGNDRDAVEWNKTQAKTKSTTYNKIQSVPR